MKNENVDDTLISSLKLPNIKLSNMKSCSSMVTSIFKDPEKNYDKWRAIIVKMNGVDNKLDLFVDNDDQYKDDIETFDFMS